MNNVERACLEAMAAAADQAAEHSGELLKFETLVDIVYQSAVRQGFNVSRENVKQAVEEADFD